MTFTHQYINNPATIDDSNQISAHIIHITQVQAPKHCSKSHYKLQNTFIGLGENLYTRNKVAKGSPTKKAYLTAFEGHWSCARYLRKRIGC